MRLLGPPSGKKKRKKKDATTLTSRAPHYRKTTQKKKKISLKSRSSMCVALSLPILGFQSLFQSYVAFALHVVIFHCGGMKEVFFF